MSRARNLAAVVSALSLLATTAGCGASSHTTNKPGTPVALSSSAVHGSVLPARYTCDGENTPPPFTWGKTPSSVRELVLFALEPRPTGPPVVLWSLAGLSSRLHSIAENSLPPGAFLETASDGRAHYSICPARGTTGHYVFALYGLPPQFGAGALPGPRLLHNLTESQPFLATPLRGELAVTYKRR